MIGYREKEYLQDVFLCKKCDYYNICRFGEGDDTCDIYLNCGANDFLQGFIYGKNMALEEENKKIQSSLPASVGREKTETR